MGLFDETVFVDVAPGSRCRAAATPSPLVPARYPRAHPTDTL
jgi:hypothetical protein